MMNILEIINYIEKQIKTHKPEIIFTHYENDLNIDHQIIYKAVITATRPLSKTFVKKFIVLKYLLAQNSHSTEILKKFLTLIFLLMLKKLLKIKSDS